MSRLMDEHKRNVASLTTDEQATFDERMAICLESGGNELRAEIAAMRQILNMRETMEVSK
jgi:hypothetical protein